VLAVSEIHTYYGDSYILQGLSLTVEEGTAVALLGRNGMGKTTTIRSIMGFTPPRRGEIHFRGKDVTHWAPHRRARLGMALCPQGRRIFPSLSVEENLTMAARGRDRAKGELWDLGRIYERYPVLKDRARLKGTSLSGGEQQMLALGRGLMTNPDLFVLDEPSEGLAPMLVRDIGKIITELCETGLSILLVEQNITMALDVADRTYVISSGKIVHEGVPSELAANESVRTQYLGVAGEQ
jgi:branched-chain amino acid transport system ATP-binding protein